MRNSSPSSARPQARPDGTEHQDVLTPNGSPDRPSRRHALRTLGAAALSLAAGPALAGSPSIYRNTGDGFSLFTRPTNEGFFEPDVGVSPWRGPTEWGLTPRVLKLRNAHTQETLQTMYWQRGDYDQNELSKMKRFMRDWRTGEEVTVDTKLLDMVWAVAQRTGTAPEFVVLSGYRSPATNQMLIDSGHSGVARDSLHMQGRAMDITVPQIPLSVLRDAALDLAAGGVGYYPSSNFLHMDTGRFRTW